MPKPTMTTRCAGSSAALGACCLSNETSVASIAGSSKHERKVELDDVVSACRHGSFDAGGVRQPRTKPKVAQEHVEARPDGHGHVVTRHRIRRHAGRRG